MKSYVVALALGMLLAAFYAVQNSSTVIVKFLMWQWSLHQGIWEVLVFGAGAIMMWIVSFASYLEFKNKYKNDIKEFKKRIADLEEEKRTLLQALQHRDTASVKDEPVGTEFIENEGVEVEK